MASPTHPLVVAQLSDPDLAMLDCAYTHADDVRALAALVGITGADEERMVKRGTLVRVNELVLLLKCVLRARARCVLCVCARALRCAPRAPPSRAPAPSPRPAGPSTPRKRASCT